MIPVLEKAMNEGRIQKAQEIARNMLIEGLDISLVAEVTGLAVDEVKRMKVCMDN